MQVIKRVILFIVSYLLMVVAFYGQDFSEWSSFVSRTNTTDVAIGDNDIFAIADGSLYSINKSCYDELKSWDRKDGLHDTNISHIEYSYQYKSLIIVYNSGLIDIISQDAISSIPDIKKTNNLLSKEVYGIQDYGTNGCFIFGKLGVVDLDLSKSVIRGNYFSSENITSIAKMKNQRSIVVALDRRVFVGNIDDNLLDLSNWKELKSLSDKNICNVCCLDNYIIALSSDKTVFIVDNNGNIISPLLFDGIIPNKVEFVRDYIDGIVIYDGLYYTVVDNLKHIIKIKSSHYYNSEFSFNGNNMFAIPMMKNGISVFKRNNNWQENVVSVKFNSPSSNNFYSLRFQDNKLLAVSGGRGGNRFFQKGHIMIFDGQNWLNIDGDYLNKYLSHEFLDPVDIIKANINGSDSYFVATWGEGVIELDTNGYFVKQYDGNNSSLMSAIPGNPNYYRVSSFDLDNSGNLWMAMGGALGANVFPIAFLNTSGHWSKYNLRNIKDTNALGQMISLDDGTKYILDFYRQDKGEGFTVFKTPNLIEFEPSKELPYRHFSKVQEYNGSLVNFSKINCMALDKSNKLWMGTDIGFFIIQNPKEMLSSNELPIVYRPIAGDTPPYYKVLDNVNITSLVVDKLNNKWIGTLDNGLFLLSDDASTVERHYNTANSPILSNNITSMAIDNNNEVLYIGTNQGLSILKIGVANYKNERPLDIEAFPNPLRYSDPDLITLKGIPIGATVKILDGFNIVFQSVSTTSTIEWRPQDMYGKRLKSGIYNVLIYLNGSYITQLNIGIVTN